MTAGCTKSRRHGALLVMVMIAMVVAAAILAAWGNTALRLRRQFQQQERELQAIWLAESAVDRAAAQWAADSQYVGETWNVAADQLGTGQNAVVTIRLQPIGDRADAREIHVTADYPADALKRVRRTRRVIFDRSEIER